MSKIEVLCPHCKKPNAVDKNRPADCYGLQSIQCSHRSKGWAENLGETERLAKSAPSQSSELSALIVQVRGQIVELTKRITALAERVAQRRPRQPGSTRAASRRLTWPRKRGKALNNGTPVTFETEASTSPRFKTAETIGVGVRLTNQGDHCRDS